MPYIQGITDRSEADIAARTKKAFFNVSDYARIKSNILFIESVLRRFHANVPTLSAMPNKGEHNMISGPEMRAMAENIERLRIAAKFLNTTGEAIFYAFSDGTRCPDYAMVNQWERILERIESTYGQLAFGRRPITSIAICGAGMTRQNGFRR